MVLDSRDFSDWAAYYDSSVVAAGTGYPFAGYQEVLARVRQHVTGSVGPILELGVGTGLLSEPLYAKGVSVWGLDFAQEMLRECAKKIPRALLFRWNLRVGMPPLGQSFSHIVSTYTLHHLEEGRKLDILAQAIDCLLPGGNLIIGDMGFLNSRQLRACRQRYAELWDPDESVMQADRLLPQVRALGVEADYEQVSLCAGVLVVKRRAHSGRANEPG